MPRLSAWVGALGAALGLAVLLAAGCGSTAGVALPPTRGVVTGPTLIPVTVGPGPRYRPAPGAREVPGAGPCGAPGPVAYGIHLELFAAGRVIVVPAGIGVRGPLVRDGALVRGGQCELRLRTLEPTGLVAVATTTGTPTLGTLFAIWGQPLTRGRLAGFEGRVLAWVNGVRWSADPAAIPLERHVQVVVEASRPLIAPHARYGFPPGY